MHALVFISTWKAWNRWFVPWQYHWHKQSTSKCICTAINPCVSLWKAASCLCEVMSYCCCCCQWSLSLLLLVWVLCKYTMALRFFYSIKQHGVYNQHSNSSYLMYNQPAVLLKLPWYTSTHTHTHTHTCLFTSYTSNYCLWGRGTCTGWVTFGGGLPFFLWLR